MKNIISKKQLREFGLLIGLGFPVIIGYLLPLISGHQFRVWSLWIGIPFLIIGILKPYLLSFPYKLWMQLGEGLGWVNSRLILGFIFVFIVQPIALFMKLFNYDPLRKRFNEDKSYREFKNEKEIDLTRIF
tara:strand:+ start:297 stop:689 length:393 start_codon:yes stop_codon:yes gene_type:complete